MKKYLQITVILGLFFAAVWLRGRTGHNNGPVVSQPSGGLGSTGTGTTSANSGGATAPVNYKDGTYTGAVADAFYGNIQVRVTISGGRITNVIFLQHPSDNGTSQRINSQAMPILQQEALQAQNAQVDGATGASLTSSAFIQSLSSALQQAS